MAVFFNEEPGMKRHWRIISTQQCWTMRKLKNAIRRLQFDRCGVEFGLAPVDRRNVKHVPHEFLAAYFALIVR